MAPKLAPLPSSTRRSLTIEATANPYQCASSGQSTSWWPPTAPIYPICCRLTPRCIGPNRRAAPQIGRDTQPTFTGTPGLYTGPVPLVPHVHGAVGVGDESDGYAEAWYLPAANNIPAGYATVGTWYDRFATQANQKFGVTWVPDTPPSSIPTRIAPRPSGITIMRSA